MKKIHNMKLWQKIVIVFLLVILFSTIVVKPVQAAVEADILLKPITGLFVGLADALEGVMQKIVLGVDESLLHVNNSENGVDFLANFLVIGAFVLGTAIAIVTAIPSGGATVVAWGAFAIEALATVAISLGTYILVGSTITNVVKKMIGDEFDFPQFALSPYEIFDNKITVLDVNFFDPKPEEKITETIKHDEPIRFSSSTGWPIESEHWDNNSCTMTVESFNSFCNEYSLNSMDDARGEQVNVGREEGYHYTWKKNETTYEADISEEWGGGNSGPLVQQYDPIHQRWTGVHVKCRNVYNFKQKYNTEKLVTVLKSPASELRSYVAGWYKTLRNFALVSLLSILVYIGIRIVLSSVASDKAKYKQMLIDWVVALSLLLVMHYIMSFSVYIVDKARQMIDSIQVDTKTKDEVRNKAGDIDIGKAVDVFILSAKDEDGNTDEDMKKIIKSSYKTMAEKKVTRLKQFFFTDLTLENQATDAESANVFVWPASNFMEEARMKYQLYRKDGSENVSMYGYGLIYVILVIYTIIFLFTYMKRVVYMAFLTVIAPLVAVTYPIDKLNDGKAQAFDMWFKEYIFNLLLQPLHLLLYSVLIGSAMNFAADNLVYVIMALGFFMPAEKLLRRFFGFEKAQTPGLFGGPAGSALMFSGLQRLMHPKPPHGGLGAGNGKDDKDSGEQDKAPRTQKIDETTGFLGNGDEEDKSINFKEKEDEINNKDKLREATEGQKEAKEAMESAKTDEERKEYQALYDSYGKDLENLRNNNDGASIPTSNNTPKNTRLTRGQRIRKGIGRGIRGYHRGLHNRYVARKAQKGGMLRRGVRLAGGIAAATAFTTATGLAAIVSGEPSKQIGNIVTAGVGGYKAGSTLGERASGSVNNQRELLRNAKEESKKGYQGSDYGKKQQEKYIKEFKKNEEYLNALQDRLNIDREQAQEIMETHAEDYVDNGITDMDEFAAVYKLEQDFGNRDKAIATRHYAMERLDGKKVKNIDPEKKAKYDNMFMQEFMKRGKSQQEAANTVNELYDAVNRFHSYKK